ncbi:hypothetical protein A4X09_0g5108 [Tilletia walkeri]|uniref:Uncharacterized protein n=1 Tax=Tilletia walkeri TaxID=117179 RepID=A0A8X7T379_9BASI|nr:hypothetical protein A4X09_0g5108 [Tilletia walkeri]
MEEDGEDASSHKPPLAIILNDNFHSLATLKLQLGLIPFSEAMVESWSDNGEGQTAGPTSGASSVRSSHPSHAPDSKRPRLEPSRSVSGQGPTPSTSAESAAIRFFNVPELLSLVLRHFDYERTELIVLSSVSKRMRANVLPRLVETLSVPLTKAKDAGIYLESEPGLASHVRYLRLWDDVGRHYWNLRPLPDERIPMQYRNQVSPIQPKDMWEQLRNLLSLLHTNTNAKYGQMPMIDLSIGLSSIGHLHTHVDQNPGFFAKLVALRLVDDFRPSEQLERPHKPGTTGKQVNHSVHGLLEKNANDLEGFIQMVCKVQDEVGSTTFRFFGITASASDFGSFDRVRFLPCLSQEVLIPLAKRIRHLSIVLDQVSGLDVLAYRSLLAPEWPQIQTFDIRIDWEQQVWNETLEKTTLSFCQRHPTLTRAGVEIHERGDPYWRNSTLPQLTACSLKINDLDYDARKANLEFLLRYNNIQELTLAEDQVHEDGELMSSHEPLRKSLRFLRAGPYAVRHFLGRNTRLRHVQVMGDEEAEPDYDDSEDGYNDEGPTRWSIFPDGRSYSSITCIDYIFNMLSIDHVFDNIVSILCPTQLPNLKELSIYVWDGCCEDVRDSSHLSALLIKQLFEQLDGCAELRAVRVGCDGVDDLPSDDKLNEMVQVLPPRLEYLTWHVPFKPTTHHYRVVRTGPLGRAAEGVGTTRPTRTRAPSQKAVQAQAQVKARTKLNTAKPELEDRKSRTARLEKLPNSFRPKVEKGTGLWEDLDDQRRCTTLFDHTGDKPVLRYAWR